jgi:general nucleoside transport system permease protein
MFLKSLQILLTADFLYSSISMAAPVILAAIGEVFLQRSGIFNIGIEGIMIFGSFFGVVGAEVSGNAWIGLLTAIVSGCLAGSLFAFFVVTLRADQTVTGTAFSIIGVGLTSFLVRVIWGIRDYPVQVASIGKWPIPLLSKIPVIGYIFFNQSPFVYLAYLLIALATFILYRTSWGLKVRAVGENPESAASLGINVMGWRYACAILEGGLAAIGGAALSLNQLNMFVDNMTSGRGYFAMAAVILGRWNPIGAAIGGLVFGMGNAIQIRWQAIGVPVPSNLLLILPYILAFLIVVFFHGRASQPAALGTSYEKEATIE